MTSLRRAVVVPLAGLLVACTAVPDGAAAGASCDAQVRAAANEVWPDYREAGSQPPAHLTRYERELFESVRTAAAIIVLGPRTPALMSHGESVYAVIVSHAATEPATSSCKLRHAYIVVHGGVAGHILKVVGPLGP